MMIDVDSCVENWANEKYSRVFTENISKYNEILEISEKSFEEMGIHGLPMTGNSVESLPRDTKSENLNGPKFSNAFHILSNLNNLKPSTYLLEITENYLSKNLDQKLLVGYLSRALRSFASFMREPDLAWKLRRILIKDDNNAKVDMNPDLDVKAHVDIRVFYKSHIFNLWSYQSTSRGLPNTIDRLSGNRGEVCEGINVLCPFKTEDAQILLNKKSSFKKKKKKITNWKNELNNNPSKKRKTNLVELINKNQKQFDELKNEINNQYNTLSKEVIIKNGWFLHADDYVISIKNMLEKCIEDSDNITDYKNLRKILLGPQEFISKVNIFKK